MDLTSSIWGFVQAPIIHILRERMKNRDSIKKLLQNKDAMEDVIRGLTEMLDQLERRVSSPGIENSTKTELFNKLEKSVRELHASMQEIKEAYRNSQTGVRFFLKSMKGYCRDRVHRKLRDQFEDVVEAIDHMESCERLIMSQAGGSSSSGMHVHTPMDVDTNSTTADTPTVRGHGRQLRSLSSSEINSQGRDQRFSRAYKTQKPPAITPPPSRRDLSKTRRDMNKAIARRQRQGKCRNSIGSINVKSAVVNAIVQVIKSPNVRETLSAILVEKWAICKVTVN
ncbi:hypothetical protein AtubIFM54640_009536 [Aspergillus tubingensis]|nr:hypothetical protein AtubIFM54640_009536 [Aspergillus tubingensis]